MNARRAVPLLTVAIALAAAAPAGASTFCVPTFHAACPNAGGRVAVASLETAMRTNGDDGTADRIVIAPGTVSDPDTIVLLGSDEDDLEIVGAGPAQTTITSTDNGNQYVMNLTEQRHVTMRDLTLRVPASFPDDAGGALQARNASFVNVDIESRNPRSDGASSLIGTNTFTDGRVYGSMGGSIDTAFSANGANGGTLTIERTTIDDASWGILSDDPEVPLYAKRVAIHDPVLYGVRITDGAFAVIENSIIEATTGTPIVAQSYTPGTIIATVRHSTIVGIDPDDDEFAVRATVDDGNNNGGINLVVADTIIDGYADPLRCAAPSSPTVGNALLTMSYSYFLHSASVAGDCTLSTQHTVDAADPAIGPPAFADGVGSYLLPAGSPAIDAGNPQTASLPTVDFLGALRPVDGDGDGVATRDIGAFEYQPPAVVPPGGGGGGGGGPEAPGVDPPVKPTPDLTAPTLTKLRLRNQPSATRRGTVTLRSSERARVTVALRRIRAGKGAKPRTLRQTFAVKQGTNSLRLRKRTLRPGRYRLSVVAIDPAGNRSRAVERAFTVTG